MIRIRQIKIDIDDTCKLKKIIAKRLNIDSAIINKIKINKRSIDARLKPKLYYIYEVDVDIIHENKVLNKISGKDIFKSPDEEYKFNECNLDKSNKIIIVGSGPAGLFVSYMFVCFGYNVTIIERGEKVEDRIKTVNKFWNDGILNEESNVQFGEGGAGTFSDGKLNTLINDRKRIKKVLETFVKFGAPKEIMYDAKPHIGTDILVNVIKNMREFLISNGCRILYNTCMTDITIDNNNVSGITINNSEFISCNKLILALGHSARDTFKMLYDKGFDMESKPFAIGVRIMHNQNIIDYAQYNRLDFLHASYKLTYKSSNNRGVYSFCMCPGGYVVNASSEKNMLAINGMSNYKRDSGVANSAIIVTVNKEDYGDSALSGMEFQRNLETAAYRAGYGLIPVQLYKDFKENRISTSFENVLPMIKGGYKFADINKILPSEICLSLKEGIDYFDTKIKGFKKDAIIAGVESRTSSPIRIKRNDCFECNIRGIYPIGEGAGYAGGITSAAIDGIKAFEKIVIDKKQ